MINKSFNGLWMGQFMQLDWDIFQFDQAYGEFHVAPRAICGGPVYVNDAIGSHKFDLIKKLVFNDGTIPKYVHYTLLTRGCLFANPLFDKKTVFKIWNLNKFGGVIEAFNCQGCGWNPNEQRVKGYSRCYKKITGMVHVEVEWDQVEICTELLGKAGEYAHKAQKLLPMARNSDTIYFTLQQSFDDLMSEDLPPGRPLDTTLNSRTKSGTTIAEGRGGNPSTGTARSPDESMIAALYHSSLLDGKLGTPFL
ncbi:stachyose synthase-like [Curcuma longa]|uniref:stachyose synthase-like n=1 Tax=Curcuma longa TaxID=136217 RepID=UPI003D9F0665